MDEVHFLADGCGGRCGRRVILQLPDDVRVVSLSATVGSAEEFGGWIQTVRGDTTVVVGEHRPVPLATRLGGQAHVRPVRYRISEAEGQLKSTASLLRHIAHRREPAGWPISGLGAGSGRPGFYRPPGRPEVIAKLDAEGLLPAITFVFPVYLLTPRSPNACDHAATSEERYRTDAE